MMPFNAEIKALMKVRVLKRLHRIENKEPIDFLPSSGYIPGSEILVSDAREGNFEGSVIPKDLQVVHLKLLKAEGLGSSRQFQFSFCILKRKLS